MPITCKIEQEAGVVFFAHVGAVSDDEFLSSYRAFYEDARSDKSMNLLVDLRRTESSARGTAALQEMADLIQRQLAGIDVRPKIAVIAPKNLSFGLARMFEAFSDTAPFDFGVFRELDAALAWLGAPEDLLEGLEQDTSTENPPAFE
jgi:hypothetical protein